MGFIYDLKLTSTPFLLIAKSTVHHYLTSLCRRHREPEYISLHYTPDLISVATRCKQHVLTLF